MTSRLHQTSHTPARIDVYDRVTAAIISQLEHGTRPWLKPWSTGHAKPNSLLPLRANGLPYRGINVLLLWGAAIDAGYTVPHWMTYKQAAERGGQVRKGERGAMVVFADRFTKFETDNKGEDVERDIPFRKTYTVFNVSQIDGLPVPPVAPVEPLRTFVLIDAAERFLLAPGGNPSWRQPGVLRPRHRPYPAAAAAGVPRR